MPPVWNGDGGDVTTPGVGGGGSGSPCADAMSRDYFDLGEVISWWMWLTSNNVTAWNAQSAEDKCVAIVDYYSRFPGGGWKRYYDFPVEENGGGGDPPPGGDEMHTVYHEYVGPSQVQVGIWSRGNRLAIRVHNTRAVFEFGGINVVVEACERMVSYLEAL